MKFTDLDKNELAIMNRISGMLNTPDLNEYMSVEHFLIEVANRISQAASLSRQISRNLGGTLNDH